MKEIKRRSDCAVAYAMDIFGDKWSLLILRDLMIKGKKSYGEFLDSKEKIATNILADRLNTLESCGIITGKTDPAKKTKIIYTLTPKGIDLLPLMIEIIQWGARYDKNTNTPKDFLKRIKEDKDGLLRDLRAELKKNSSS